MDGSRLSPYTAENQYGMVGFGAGPAGLAVAAPPAPVNGAATQPTEPAGALSNLVMPAGVAALEDPTFWMIATLGAVIGLAAYSAGQST